LRYETATTNCLLNKKGNVGTT